jgi:hypothetical protein
MGRVVSVTGPGEKVIGFVQCHEALGVQGRLEDGTRLAEADCAVVGCMKDQQGAPQLLDPFSLILLLQVLEKGAPQPPMSTSASPWGCRRSRPDVRSKCRSSPWLSRVTGRKGLPLVPVVRCTSNAGAATTLSGCS